MNRRSPLALPIQVPLAAGGTQTLQPPPKSAGPPNPLFPDDAEFWYETLRMLGADEYGASSFGEVLAISRQIKAGDYDGWYDAWNSAGDRLAGEADAQLARGHKVSARDNYLRAANDYRSSEFFLHATPKDARVVRAYSRQIETYKAAARLFDVPIEPVEIPYEATSLPGYFQRVDQSDRPRPLLIMHTGFDGSAEEMHWSGARGDLFFKGQADELFNHLTCRKTLLRFSEAEGAGAHCQMGAGRLAFARIFDWLDETLAPG